MEQLNNSLFSEKTIWHTVLCNSSSVTHQGWWEYKVAPHLGSFLSNEAVLSNETYIYYMIEQSHSWVFIQDE